MMSAAVRRANVKDLAALKALLEGGDATNAGRRSPGDF